MNRSISRIQNVKKIVLVLASGSPRRQQILQNLGIRFQTAIPDVEETWEEKDDPVEVAVTLAERKAASVAHFGHLVVAMDTMVVVGGKKLGSPNPMRRRAGCWKRSAARCTV